MWKCATPHLLYYVIHRPSQLVKARQLKTSIWVRILWKPTNRYYLSIYSVTSKSDNTVYTIAWSISCETSGLSLTRSNFSNNVKNSSSGQISMLVILYIISLMVCVILIVSVLCFHFRGVYCIVEISIFEQLFPSPFVLISCFLFNSLYVLFWATLYFNFKSYI